MYFELRKSQCPGAFRPEHVLLCMFQGFRVSYLFCVLWPGQWLLLLADALFVVAENTGGGRRKLQVLSMLPSTNTHVTTSYIVPHHTTGICSMGVRIPLWDLTVSLVLSALVCWQCCSFDIHFAAKTRALFKPGVWFRAPIQCTFSMTGTLPSGVTQKYVWFIDLHQYWRAFSLDDWGVGPTSAFLGCWSATVLHGTHC